MIPTISPRQRKLHRHILEVALLVGSLSSGCVVPTPMPCLRTIESSSTRGVHPQTEDSIISKQVHYPYFCPYSITGDKIDGEERTLYYLKRGRNETRLRFLQKLETYPDYPLMYEIFPVVGTDRWVAFQLRQIRRDSVDLKLIVFNERKVHQELLVQTARRVSASSSGFNHIAKYSIECYPQIGKVIISTMDGLVTYDGPMNILTTNED